MEKDRQMKQSADYGFNLIKSRKDLNRITSINWVVIHASFTQGTQSHCLGGGDGGFSPPHTGNPIIILSSLSAMPWR